MLNINILKCTYTNEQILVILLTRLYFGTQAVEDIDGFLNTQVINWDRFYKLLLVNDIRGFVYDVITSSNVRIDQQIRDTLKKDVMAITLLGSYQADVIGHLMTEFEKLGITVIPYKGSTLANRYYRKPLLRESSDIDFFVNKETVPQLRRCLDENGYKPKLDISEHQIDFIMRFHRELSFISPKSKIGITCSVEIQWDLLESYFGRFPQYDFFVKHLQSYTHSDGTSQICLTPTYDFLCVASHHLIRESLTRFKFLIDLACIVQSSSSQLDWEEINLQFRSCNFSASLWSGMNALEDIIGLELPEENRSGVPYHLFTGTDTRVGSEIFFRKIWLATLNHTFLEKMKINMKVYLSLLVPNIHDLAKTDAPAWTIPLITPVKSLKFLYKSITKKR